MSQAELSRAAGLSPASVSNIVRELSEQGLVTVKAGLRGRRQISEVSLAPREETVLAVDLGHRRMRLALLEADGEIVAEADDALPVNWHQLTDTDFLPAAVERLRAASGNPSRPVALAAIGIPAPLDQQTGIVSNMAPVWAGQNVGERLRESLSMTVLLDNDANLAAAGEARWGAGRACRDFVYVKLSHGLGSGLVLGGEVYHGGLGVAGEIGHTTVRPDGALCACGGRGCLELYAGGRAIAAALAEVHGARPALQEIVERCRAGEPSYQRAVADAGEQLGVVLGNVANLIAPNRIIIGGELSAAGDVLLDAIRRAVHQGSARTLADRVDVVAGELGDRAGLLGAADLALAGLYESLGIPTRHAATPVVATTLAELS